MRRRFVAAESFEAQCLGLMDEVAASGEPIVVTKRGNPIMMIVPAAWQDPHDLIGSIVEERDLLAPIDADWKAENA